MSYSSSSDPLSKTPCTSRAISSSLSENDGKYDNIGIVTSDIDRIKADIEAKVRAEIEQKMRAEMEEKVRIEVEVKMREEMKRLEKERKQQEEERKQQEKYRSLHQQVKGYLRYRSWVQDLAIRLIEKDMESDNPRYVRAYYNRRYESLDNGRYDSLYTIIGDDFRKYEYCENLSEEDFWMLIESIGMEQFLDFMNDGVEDEDEKRDPLEWMCTELRTFTLYEGGLTDKIEEIIGEALGERFGLEVLNDGMVHPVVLEGKNYMANSAGCVWSVTAKGLKWAGKVDMRTGDIEPWIREPQYNKDSSGSYIKPLMTQDTQIIWNIPDDGLVHPWIFQGNTYLVNGQRCVWSFTSKGLPGKWVGMVDLEKGIIDTSVKEPDEYDEE